MTYTESTVEQYLESIEPEDDPFLKPFIITGNVEQFKPRRTETEMQDIYKKVCDSLPINEIFVAKHYTDKYNVNATKFAKFAEKHFKKLGYEYKRATKGFIVTG